VEFDDKGNTHQGPEFVAEAVGPGPLVQKREQVLRLCGVEFGLTAPRMGFGLEACLWGLDCRITPPAHRTGRSLDVAGHFSGAPAGFEERDGAAVSNFELDGSAWRSHKGHIGRMSLSLQPLQRSVESLDA
jgi:hypothetical protein